MFVTDWASEGEGFHHMVFTMCKLTLGILESVGDSLNIAAPSAPSPLLNLFSPWGVDGWITQLTFTGYHLGHYICPDTIAEP
jgi:hypothetical protein